MHISHSLLNSSMKVPVLCIAEKSRIMPVNISIQSAICLDMWNSTMLEEATISRLQR